MIAGFTTRSGGPAFSAARQVRRALSVGLTGGLVVAGAAVGVAAGTGTAAASTTTTLGVGTHSVVVPDDAVSVTFDVLGAAGFVGDPASGDVSQGGKAGSGTDVTLTYPVGPSQRVKAGDVLTVVVGTKGGGGQRGSGQGLGGSGGNGGGASYVTDSGSYLLVAGGGGGGGGGGGAFVDYDGGRGGKNSAGTPSKIANTAGRGGAFGTDYNCSTGHFTAGEAGESSGTLGSSGGGGGGGGEGFCGGQGGGSGDHGDGAAAGGAGGGGGGAGGSEYQSGTTGTPTFVGGGNADVGDGNGAAVVTVRHAPTNPVDTTPIEFGSQAVGSQSDFRYISLTNNGDVVMTGIGLGLVGAAPADFRGNLGTCFANLEPGSSCQFGVAFAPTAPGRRTATLQVFDSAGGPQQIPLGGSGTGVPTVSPSPVSFAGVLAGGSGPAQTVTLHNNQATPLTMSGTPAVAVWGATGDFTVSNDTCSGQTIPAAGTCTADVAFTPRATSTGLVQAALAFSDDAGNSPQLVTLQGTALTAPHGTIFGDTTFATPVAPGASSDVHPLGLGNDGPGTLMVNAEAANPPGVQVVGPNASYFTVSNDSCSGVVLPQGYACGFSIAFTPPAGATGGVRTATLQVAGALASSPAIATLTGTVVGSHGNAFPNPVDFGALAPGSVSPVQSVGLGNDGPGSLIVNGAADSPAGVRITGPQASMFTVSTDSCSGTVIQFQYQCSVGVVFAPPADAASGVATATLTFTTDGSNSPVTTTLTGTVQRPATATLSQGSVDFGTALVGSSGPPGLVTLTNNGDVPLNLASIGLDGAAPADFTGQFGTCHATVAPHASCQIGASFNPVAVGTRTATLLITDSAPNSPQLVSLTGIGATPPTAPTIGTATPGNGSAEVSFTPPSSDGGSPVTGYTVTAAPGGRTATGSTSPVTVTGLTPGTAYTFTVTATNAVGTGPASGPTAAVTPTAVPVISGQPPAGGVGEPYRFAFLLTGSPTPTVSKSIGTLPPGVTLSRTGALAGTPTKAGSYSFTVLAAGAAGTASEAVKLVIRPQPAISIANNNVLEGNSGTTALVFRVSLSRTSTVSVIVHWNTANGSAVAPGDYVAASGTVTFKPGQTVQTITVLVRGDRSREPNEVFFVLLHDVMAATIANTNASGGIRNED